MAFVDLDILNMDDYKAIADNVLGAVARLSNRVTVSANGDFIPVENRSIEIDGDALKAFEAVCHHAANKGVDLVEKLGVPRDVAMRLTMGKEEYLAEVSRQDEASPALDAAQPNSNEPAIEETPARAPAEEPVRTGTEGDHSAEL